MSSISSNTYRSMLPALCILTAAIVAPQLKADETKTGFVERVYRDENGDHKYTVFVPAAYTPEKQWPVILYLHGASGRGTDNKLQLSEGVPAYVRPRVDKFPALVVVPQCEDTECRMLEGWLADSPDGKRAVAIMDAVEQDYNVDRGREVITGVSMGGCGAWSIAAATPNRWAGIAVISGSGDPWTVEKLKDVPVWAFHGGRDLAVSLDEGRHMIDVIRAAGGQRAYFTSLSGKRHYIAHLVYADDALYTWMLDPKSEPRPENILRNAETKKSPQELGLDIPGEFIPIVEIPQALYARLDGDALQAIVDSLSDSLPAEKLTGTLGDVYQTARARGFRFNVHLSGLNYHGQLERIIVTPHKDGTVRMDLGIRNATMQIGTTQINGRMVSATAGPMDIVIGHQRPVWMSFEVRPYIESKKLKMELRGVGFEIPDDNWYVTTPYVVTRGVPLMRNRISQGVSQNLVNGTYSRKHEIESQVTATAPALLEQVTQQIQEGLEKMRSITSWPMPAERPCYKLWPDQIKVDESGMSIIVGMMLGTTSPKAQRHPLHRIDVANVTCDDLPKLAGLQIGTTGSMVEAISMLMIDSGSAVGDARDLKAEALIALADPQTMRELIPDLARYGDGLQVRTMLRLSDPVYLSGVPREADAEADSNAEGETRSPRDSINKQVQVRLPRVRIDVRIKTNPEQKNWMPCATFEIAFDQRFGMEIQEPEFTKRLLSIQIDGETGITANGQFVPGYQADDLRMDNSRVARLLENAWRTGPFLKQLQDMPGKELKLGKSVLRVANAGWSEPFIVMQFLPAPTRITNGSGESIEYEVRGPFTKWGGPYTLKPGQSHDYKVAYPLTLRQRSTTGEITQLLPMGELSIVVPSAEGSNKISLKPKASEEGESN